MDVVSISKSEEEGYREYQKNKRRTELKYKLQKLQTSFLKKGATIAELKNFCSETKELNLHRILCCSGYVKPLKMIFDGYPVSMACAVTCQEELPIKAKLFIVKQAIKDGAEEIVYEPSFGPFLSQHYAQFKSEIKKAMKTAKKKTFVFRPNCQKFTYEQLTKSIEIAISSGVKVVSMPAEIDLVSAVRERFLGKCDIFVYGVERVEEYQDLASFGCSKIATANAEEIITTLQNEYE